MCVGDSENVCFHKILFLGAKLAEADFMLTFSSMLESLLGPSLC